MRRNSFIHLYILAIFFSLFSSAGVLANYPPESDMLFPHEDKIHGEEEIQEAPQNFRASNITPFTADLSWDPLNEVAYYVILRDNALFNFDQYDITSIRIAGLTPGTNYNFQVVAFFLNGGISDVSADLQFRTLDEVVSDPPVVCNTTFNLSQGKPAKQSSTKDGGIASYAVDGSLSESNLQHTQNSENPWWQVDLEDLYHVKEIHVYNRVGCCGDRIKNFRVFISPYPFSDFADLPELEVDPNVHTLTGSNTNESLYSFELSETVLGRYVRIQLPITQSLHMREVVVMGCTGNEPPLGIPQNLRATNVEATSITLKWDAVSGADKYIVYQDGVEVKEVSGTTAELTGLTPETWYSYKVAAVRGNDLSEKSESLRVRTINEPDPLGVPQNLVASNVTINSVNLNWDAVSEAEKYIVYQDAVAVKEVTNNATQITGLNQDTEYSFRVAAIRGSETSGKSNTATIRTLQVADPVDPGNCNYPVNLALNKPASSSSVRNGGIAAYAVNGAISENNLQHTQQENEAWWQVDLEEVYYLRQIKIFNRTSCCGGRIRNFMLFISDYPMSENATVTQLKNDDNVTAINGPNDNDPSYEFNLNENLTGRYIRIQLQDNDFLHMKEVEVYGCDGIDQAPLGTPQNLVASNVTINSVNLNWDEVNEAEKYIVYQDGVAVKEVTNNATQITGLNQDTEYSFRVAAVRGSETSGKSNTATIRTLQEADPVDPGNCNSPVNLALNKPATSSSVRNGGIAGYAVNGVISENNLQHTEKENEAWWQVDLEEIYYLRQVKIFNRTSCCGGRIRNFMLFISNYPISENATVAQLQNDANVTAINGSDDNEASYELNLNEDLTGRYIRIQLQDNDYLHMREVQVFGCDGVNQPDPLDIPQNLVASNVTINSVDLSWDEVNEAEKYIVYQDGVAVKEIANNATQITGLDQDTEYSFRVAAVRGSETSGKSNTATIRTLQEADPVDPGNCSSLVNLALNKPATSSSVYNGGEASYAVNGAISENDLQHTQEENEAWWQVDLEEVYYLRQIKIFNRTSCCGGRIRDFMLFISDYPMAENATVTQLKNDANVTAINGPDADQASYEFELNENLTGRYVRVQLQDTDNLHMREVEVYGCDGVNQPDPLGVPQNLVASNVTTNSVNLDWDTVSEAEKYIVYQDGVAVKEVDNSNTQITGLSQDTEYSFQVAAVRGSETSAKSNTATIRTLQEQDPVPPGDCDSPINLALNKPASQSSTKGNGVAGLAVDGNLVGTTNWGASADLQHTDKDGEPWWQVDLGNVYQIKEIKITNRTDCCQSRLKNFVVFSSETPFPDNASIAELENTAGIHIINQSEAVVTDISFQQEHTGRYVRVQLRQTTNSLHMSEVEIFGCEEGDQPGPDPLGVPQNLVASNVTTNSVNLDWDAVSEAEKYIVYQDGVAVTEVTTPTTQISGLTQDTEYSFQVAAVRGSETSAKSNTATIRTLQEQDPVPPGDCDSPINLALNKPASQSSTKGNGVAGLAVDGNLVGTTNWGASADLQHTDKDGEPWWQVDLGNVYQIKEIKITNRTDCCQSRLKNFVVFSSETPFPDNASIAELENTAGIHIISQSEAVVTDISFQQEHTGRYVRVQLRQTTNSLHMSEVEIFGCEEGNQPDPLGVPQNLVASNVTTNSVNLDWEAVSEAEKYIVYQDGVAVTEVTTPATQITGLSQDTEYSFEVAAVRGSETSAKSNTVTIRTLQEQDPVPPGDCDSPVNLALNKPASQSSTKGVGVAGFAVDGNLVGTTNWGASADLQHTDKDGEPWWQVDLGNVYQIKEIKITNRTDCCQSRLKNFVVFSSETPFPDNASIAELENTAGIHIISQSEAVVTDISFQQEHTGRYVRVQLRQTTNSLHMSEVEIFGCELNPGPLPPPKGKMLQELVDLNRTYEGSVDQVFTDDNLNYIHTINHQEAGSSSPEDQWENITYFDGVGRPIQSVDAQASFGGVDMVTPIVYDELGRQDISYLPYAHDGSPVAGRYKDNWESRQGGFYSGLTSISGSADKPYAVSQFEASPLNRVIEQGAPGTDWQPTSNPGVQGGGEHTVVTEYLKTTSNLLGFRPEDLDDGTVQKRNSYYPAGTLTVTRVTDENGGVSETATDNLGRMIYKSVMISGSKLNTPWTTDTYATTYYVYDAFGNIRFVIQPEGWRELRGKNLTADIREKYCFQYEYDSRQRVIRKRVPGADWVEMVYDRLDRVVATRDGNLKEKGQWLVTKYDNLGRPVMTGIHSGGGDRGGLQGTVDANGSVFETFNGNGYSNSVNPTIDSDKFHSITFYDDYGFAGDGYDFKGEGTFGFLARPTGITVDYFPAESSQGRVTGVRVFILDPEPDMPAYLQTVTYYDKYGREIQTIAQNHLNKLDIVGNRYSFTGELLESVQFHNWDGAVGEQRIHKAFLYDHRSRLLEVMQQINGDNAIILSRHEYDELGQLVEKDLGGCETDDELQSIDYLYNIRGWMTNINQTGSTDDGDLFGMNLGYNEGNGALYNGNISTLNWEMFTGVEGQDALRTYDFLYDKMNRLTSASFSGGLGGEKYSVQGISYDLNGNILSLNREGKTSASTHGILDQLSYAYEGNRITTLTEGNAAQKDIIEEVDHFTTKNNGGAYQYDASGNIEIDPHKGITYTYNHLNKPTTADFGDGKYINWIYSADGTKLQEYYTGDSTGTHDYVGGFFYKDDELKHIGHEEGRALKIGNSFRYEFNLTDHLGNVRVSFTDKDYDGNLEEGEVLQTDHYYPFGMRMGGLSLNSGEENRYRYNGKEFHQEFNLGLYDYGARMYDPAVGRFTGVDPKVEYFRFQGDYVYAANNPVVFHEKDGENPVLGVLRFVVQKATNYAAKKAAKAVQKKTLKKAKRSLEKNVKEHIKKYDDFMEDPIKNSSKEALEIMTKDNPSKDVLLERAKGRGTSLLKQVEKNKGELKKVNKQLKELNKTSEDVKKGATAVATNAAAKKAVEAVTPSVDAQVDLLKTATSLTGQDTKTAANAGKKVLGDNRVGRFIDDWINPFGIVDDINTLIITGAILLANDE